MGQIKKYIIQGKILKKSYTATNRKNSTLKKVLGEDFNSPQPKKKSCTANRANESWDLIKRYPSTTLYTIP